jgi:hypothetical protein
MTPKEKALDIYHKMHYQNQIVSIEAKQCALIAVDEIINSSPLEPAHPYDYVIAEQEAMEFWTKVKEEIEKL